jgi:hypothetical protein
VDYKIWNWLFPFSIIGYICWLLLGILLALYVIFSIAKAAGWGLFSTICAGFVVFCMVVYLVVAIFER